jgi:hypothetical protein
MTYRLLVLRHGQSEWNAAGVFTGWANAHLTARGEDEAARAGTLLAEHGVLPVFAHTSLQRRTIRTAELALAGVSHEFRFAQGHRGPPDDDRHDLFAEPRVGDADHSRLGHRRVPVQHVLDLARIHVVAAADDELLLAADKEQEPVLVEVAEVTGAQPVTGEGASGRLGAIEVSLHHVRAAGDDLAHVLRAGRQRPVVVAPDLRLGAPDGLADAVRAALRRADVEGGRRRGLRHPVTLQDDQPEAKTGRSGPGQPVHVV